MVLTLFTYKNTFAVDRNVLFDYMNV